MKQQSTEKQKREMIQEHFAYELVNLLNIEILRKVNWSNENSRQISINIFVDNILLHSRNLFEFFYDNNAKKTNFAYANHFIPNWKEIRPIKTEQIKQMEKRINNECTHLTYKRLVGIEHNGWILNDLRLDFFNVVKIFLDNLSQGYFNENLKILHKQVNQILLKNETTNTD